MIVSVEIERDTKRKTEKEINFYVNFTFTAERDTKRK